MGRKLDELIAVPGMVSNDKAQDEMQNILQQDDVLIFWVLKTV